MRARRLLLMLALLSSPSAVPLRGADAAPVPEPVRTLVGTYTGSWTLFGVDAKGQVVKRMAWTDTVKAANPERTAERAFVTTTDDMTFEGAPAPFKVQGQEGYFLTKDGGLGDYFIESNGQVHRMVKLADDVWSYVAPAAGPELARLGFPAGASGRHVLVKVVTREQGVETHRISRVTTVTWKDKAGTERTTQFVSLQGFHKRQP